MDAGKILHELTHIDGLPREALKAASAQRSEMVPVKASALFAHRGVSAPRAREGIKLQNNRPQIFRLRAPRDRGSPFIRWLIGRIGHKCH
jgi:hypothetical protein